MTQAATKPKKKSKLADIWRRLKKNKGAVISMFLIIAIVLVAIFAPYIAPYDYDTQGETPFAEHGQEHLLGTDRLGRDVLSRLIYGARQSLLIGVASVALAAVMFLCVSAVGLLPLHPLPMLILQVIAGVAIYAGLALLLHLESARYLLDMIHSLLNRRRSA